MKKVIKLTTFVFSCTVLYSGGFAWYLDVDLTDGTSAASATYLNPCLTGKEEQFKVRCVEVWGFVVKS
jgi:hypothetical protein